MLKHIKVCLLKQIWEYTNSSKKLLFSLVINCAIILWFFIRTIHTTFMGMNFTSFTLLYVIIWCIMMSLTLVNDIITENNNLGITEQIFLSSCNLNRYIIIQIINKSIFSIVFITIIISVCNCITRDLNVTTIISFFITLIIGVFSVIGTGYIISSVSLLLNYKNISLIFRIIFIVVMIKSDKNIFIPFTYCKYYLTSLFSEKVYLWNHNSLDIIGLITNSAIYFLAGCFLFFKLTSKQYIIQEDF